MAGVKAHTGNTVCITRAYVGRQRRMEKHSAFRSFWLRNFPLHLDQMRELRIDVNGTLRAITEALAFHYWSAKVNANHVEFVLAPPSLDRKLKTFTSDTLGDYVVWVLDFDCCRDMTMDRPGIEQAARAVLRNDPYFPQPGREMWEDLKGTFLEASKRVLEQQKDIPKNLPALLLQTLKNFDRKKVSDGSDLYPST